MRDNEHSRGVLADAAAGLNQQLQAELVRMADFVAPRESGLQLRFQRKLKTLGYDAPQRDSLCAITPGAAASLLSDGQPLPVFLEKVQYRGRRLAKLGLTPASVVAALSEYDRILQAELLRRFPQEEANLGWVRGQLHFLVILTLNNAFYQVREAESQAFYELFRVEVESRTLGEMLPRFLAVLREYTGADDASIYLISDDGREWTPPDHPDQRGLEIRPAVRKAVTRPKLLLAGSAASDLVLDPGWRGRFESVWSIPMIADGLLRGIAQFGFARRYEWLPRELELLTAAAERCWLSAEKARLLENLARREEQVRRLAEHMVEVEESERRRISRELHDEAGQSLLCVRLQIEMLEHDLPESAEPWRHRLQEVRQMTEHTIVEIRRLIAALSPAILEQMGLLAALRQLIGRFRRLHPAEVRLQLPRKLELPKKVEIILYRLVQEIFNNIAKYSLATHVNLSVDPADGCLTMHVEDNGVGFDVQEAFSRRDCFGLSGLRERVALLGGALEVKSLPKAKTGDSAGGLGAGLRDEAKALGRIGVDRHGTSIRIELPVAKPEPARPHRRDIEGMRQPAQRHRGLGKTRD